MYIYIKKKFTKFKNVKNLNVSYNLFRKKLRTIRTDDALDTISYRGSLHAKPMISYYKLCSHCHQDVV